MDLSTNSIGQVAPAAEPQKRNGGCGGKGPVSSVRSKWLLVAAIVLAVAGLALGSSILGFAAILPLLFILPCLVMAVMCKKGHGKGGTSDSGNAS